MQILSTFTADGATTVQTAHIDQESGVLILVESSGETREELKIESSGAYELLLYLQTAFEGSDD